jgi:hypothetical protein
MDREFCKIVGRVALYLEQHPVEEALAVKRHWTRLFKSSTTYT